ncbi:hypothetical protein BMUNKI379_07150 [Burkholderia multivorans]|nr:hypothetical protein BMUNKI379_07150 [Burkholderia multivorans]
MLHFLKGFKIAMDRHCGKLFIVNKEQRFECGPFRVGQSPPAAQLCSRNALAERRIRRAVQFGSAVGTQIECECEYI